ncbi:MAG: HIRAN domain-containing protein [Clostridiales bacterium]|nr:HIRAN domain-containing protein [Clostridiales bacterium]
MANELSKMETGLAGVSAGGGLGDLLKPLTREIHLFDSYVAGTSHLKDKTVLDEIKEGDRLFLLREDNKFDSNAVMMLSQDKKKAGYVPEKDNVVFARLMDAGKKLTAVVTGIEHKGSFVKIAVSIYLVDF